MDIQVDQVYSLTGHDVTSCFRSAFTEVRKTAEKLFESNFNGAAFCLAQSLSGLLVKFETADNFERLVNFMC